MLPPNSVMNRIGSGIVVVRLEMSREDVADAGAVAIATGAGCARGGGRALRECAHAYRAHQLSNRAAGRRRADGHGDRLAGAAWTRPGAQDPAPVPQRRPGRT